MADDDSDFVGFIRKDGKMISIKETERVYAVFLSTKDAGKVVEYLRCLAEKCIESGYYDAACEYMRRVLPLVETPVDKAECFLRIGSALELLRDFEAAEKAYSQAFDLPQERNDTWYFLNNNRGYCLNQAGRYREALQYCRAAIRINPRRHNAHKNLGVALGKTGRIREAAKRFIRATELCPVNPRALVHLDELFVHHRGILLKTVNFPEQLLNCHELVERAKGSFSVQ